MAQRYEKDDSAILPAVDHRDTPGTFREAPGSFPDSKVEGNEKNRLEAAYEHDEIVAADDDVNTIVEHMQHGGVVTPKMRAKVRAYYGHKAEEDGIAPSNDVEVILDRIIEMSEDEALDILVNAIEFHREDYNFPAYTMDKIKNLVQGYKATDMEASDWSFELRAEAAIIHYHSPYAEVRAVTSPFDDPDEPCETWRAYFLGMCFMAGVSALNTFFAPRQPAISVSSNVLQLLLAPCGKFLGKVLPDWGFTMRGKRFTLNPGPWTYKEQMFATIMFTIASGAGGTYYVYLVQRLPQYLNQQWVTFGYEILLAISVQTFGFGFAGLLRRFVIYPVNAVWPSTLPTLALNRALVLPEKKGENIHGWKLTRYSYFMACFGIMFCYFWVTNSLFTALRAFNWMTWIAPNNFSLGMITGFWGGMGFNPIATFDWNVINSISPLVTPWWAQIQQYIARVLSGLIIIGMYWSNAYWASYTPINSNESFDNHGIVYNVTNIMGDDGYVNVEKYKQYGPPYFAGANVFGQGAWFAWYALTLSYILIRSWTPISSSWVAMVRNVRLGGDAWGDNDDAHTRMMRKYKPVPDWWFMVILAIAFAFGVSALEGWPTRTPWWALLLLLVVNGIFLVPVAIMYAASNVQMSLGLFFQMISGCLFRGNPEANIICNAYATTFNSDADNFISDLKIAHYAKLPPRAVFRAQVIAVYLNCFIFVGMLNWMVTNFQNGTLCEWNNPQHFVCTDAVLTYATAVQFGAFGVPNLFKLYPIYPYCFLIGLIIGVTFAVGQKFARVERFFFYPLSYLVNFHPAVFWNGALNWTGGNNLSYANGGIVLSFVFMYYLKRHYPRWWEKYNYLTYAGFQVGTAISAIIQTFVFSFTNHEKGISLKWWGNTVSEAGIDYKAYNQNASLLPLPAKGYFGLEPDQYPLNFNGVR